MKKCLLSTVALCWLATSAYADDAAPSFEPWKNYATPQGEWLRLAAADMDMAGMSHGNMSSETEAVPYEDRTFTANKLHKWLGIGSIGAAALTVIAPKEHDGAHEYLADTALALGVGAVITGFLFHGEEIQLSNGFSDPDNLHMLLGTLGTLGYAGAVSEGGDSGHEAFGIGGAVAMAVGIKMVW